MELMILKSINTYRNNWFSFWEHKSPGAQKVNLKLLAFFSALLFTFAFLRIGMTWLFSISFDDYFREVLFIEWLQSKIINAYVIVPALLAAILLNRRLFVSWGSFENGRLLKRICLVVAGILVWKNAFYEYNLFLDQTHVWDRVLLILFLTVSFWRPIGLLLVVGQTLILLGQFQLLAGYSLAESLLPIHILLGFLACFFFKTISRYFSFGNFLFLTGCIVISHYFYSGLAKLSYEWVFEDKLNLLLPESYTAGWLKFLSEQSIEIITLLLGKFNVLLKVLTLGVEIGLIFFFYRLNWAKRLLFLSLTFHLGIFLVTGICFWLWSTLHVFFLLYVWKKETVEKYNLFNRQRLLLSILIIGTANLWSNPVRLAWFELPIIYVYELEAVSNTQEKYVLSPDFFGGYDYQMTLAKLYFLDSVTNRLEVYGTSDNIKETFRFFQQERLRDEILTYEKDHSMNRYDERRRNALHKFLRTYVHNVNKNRASGKSYLSFLKSPDLLWRGSGICRFPEGQTIERIDVSCHTYYYTTENFNQLLKTEKIDSIFINK